MSRFDVYQNNNYFLKVDEERMLKMDVTFSHFHDTTYEQTCQVERVVSE